MQALAAILEDVRTGRRPPWPCRPEPYAVQFASHAFFTRLSEVLHFGSDPGNLRMLKFIPWRLREGAPLVVVLHGCGQTAHDINEGAGWSKLANEHGFALLFPEQRVSNNRKRGFNWFKPEDSRRGLGEVLSIRQMIRRMVIDHKIDRSRIYVAGLSAGGAMTSALLASYPDVFAGGAIIAGLPFGIASSLWGALSAMKGIAVRSSESLGNEVRAVSSKKAVWPRISIWHGTKDKTVAVSNALAIVRQWCNVHGLDERPAAEVNIAGHARSIWRNAAGLPVIECHLFEGMGHAVPVDGSVEDTPLPFFEDVGVSSAHRIAEFFGILRQSVRRAPPWPPVNKDANAKRAAVAPVARRIVVPA